MSEAATPRVAILGANGQVGTELCYYLAVMGFCRPIAVTRSPNSTALLRRADIECRSGDLSDPATAAALLSDCDLVFDLALPRGRNLSHTRAMLDARLKSIVGAARPSRGFVLASTTSVYRFAPAIPSFRAYRSMKRYSERIWADAAAKRGVPAFVFRLGQVHGEMQSISEMLARELSVPGRVVRVPDQPSNAIFVYSIAQALRLLLEGPVDSGTYTLVENPAPTFEALISWYAADLGITVNLAAERTTMQSATAHTFAALRGWLTQGAAQIVSHQKELLSAAVSAYSEELDSRLRFRRMQKIAAAAIASYDESLVYRPFDPLYPVPGRRLPVAADWRNAMAEPRRRVAALIGRLAT